MKKLFLMLLLAVTFTGCMRESTFIDNVKSKFPNCEIRNLPNKNLYHCLVKTTDGKIIYIHNDGFNNLVAYDMF